MRRRHILWLALGAIATVGIACRGNNATPVSAASTSTSSALGCRGIPGLPENVADHGRSPVVGTEPTVEVGDSFFTPTCLDSVTEGAVPLVVHNAGQRLHNVSIPEQDIDADVPAGQTITVTIDVRSAPITYFCKYHRTSGMAGALLPAGA